MSTNNLPNPYISTLHKSNINQISNPKQMHLITTKRPTHARTKSFQTIYLSIPASQHRNSIPSPIRHPIPTHATLSRPENQR